MKLRLKQYQNTHIQLPNKEMSSPRKLKSGRESATTTAETKQFSSIFKQKTAVKNANAVSSFNCISKNAYDAIKKNITVAVRSNNMKYIEKKGRMLSAECFNFKDADGNTPLHFACANGYPSMARLLLRLGAKIGAKNGEGNTPLHLAFKGNDHEVALRLMC